MNLLELGESVAMQKAVEIQKAAICLYALLNECKHAILIQMHHQSAWTKD